MSAYQVGTMSPHTHRTTMSVYIGVCACSIQGLCATAEIKGCRERQEVCSRVLVLQCDNLPQCQIWVLRESQEQRRKEEPSGMGKCLVTVYWTPVPKAWLWFDSAHPVKPFSDLKKTPVSPYNVSQASHHNLIKLDTSTNWHCQCLTALLWFCGHLNSFLRLPHYVLSHTRMERTYTDTHQQPCVNTAGWKISLVIINFTSWLRRNNPSDIS